MKKMEKIMAVIVLKLLEFGKRWADDEMSPPEWADPVKWKESLL